MSEMKNILDGINSRFNTTEEKKLKIKQEIVSKMKHRERKDKKNSKQKINKHIKKKN